MANFRAVEWAYRVRGCIVVEKFVLHYLGVRADKSENGAWPAVGTISRMMGTDRRHIESALKNLIEKGFISKEARWWGKRRTSNYYKFNMTRLFPVGRWSDDGDKLLSIIKTALREAVNDQTLLDGLLSAGLDYNRKRPVLWIVIESQSAQRNLMPHWKSVQEFLRFKLGTVRVSRRNPTTRKRETIQDLPFDIEFIPLYEDFA